MNNETRVISKNKSGKRYARSAAKALLAGLILLLTIIPQAGCGSHEAEPVSGSDVYLDTQCDITVFGMKESEAQEIITGAFGEIASYESHLSRTIEGSDVDRVNHAEGKTVTVDSGTAEAILAGLEAGKYSNGDFDITIGRVTALWDFKSDDPSVPAADEIKEAVATVDYRDVDINNNEVTLKNPRAELDLGGIAKGFVADRTADYLEEQGVTSGIVNLGGNVVAIGVKADDTPFVIGVERPYSDRTEIIGSIPASDQTVVTSGIYERKFEQDGILYHHILDPETGYPVKTDLEAVTIVADKGNSCFCDGLSTSCLMAGLKGAQKLVARMQKEHPDKHIEALFVDKNDNVTMTDGMKFDPIPEAE